MLFNYNAIKVGGGGGGSHSLTGVEGVPRRAECAHAILEQPLSTNAHHILTLHDTGF